MANLIQHIATAANPLAAVTEALENLIVTLPNASLSGNSLVCVVMYPNGATPAITDDKGNTWPASGAAGTITADAGAGNMSLQAFVLNNATTGTQSITIGFGGHPQQPVRAWVSEFYNVTGTLEGHTTATAVNSSGTISPGAFTPSVDNCLVLSYMAGSNTTGNTNPTLITAASGYALNDADISWNLGSSTPGASQFLLQGTKASTTASFALTAGGTDTYNVIAFALSTGTQGTAKPATGIHIDRILYYGTGSIPASYKVQIPSTGNLGCLMVREDQIGGGTVSTTDSDSVSWTNAGQAGGPIFIYRAASAADPTRTVTMNYTGHTGGNLDFRYFDISGADPAPFDLTAFIPSSDGSNTNSLASAPSITPTTANGLVIAAISNGLGPTLGISSPTGGIFDEQTYQTAQFVGSITGTSLAVTSTTWGTIGQLGFSCVTGSGVTLGTSIQSGSGPYVVKPSQTVGAGTTMNETWSDSSIINWGNGLAHYYNPDTTAVNFTWTFANQPSVSMIAGAIAFKAKMPYSGPPCVLPTVVRTH